MKRLASLLGLLLTAALATPAGANDRVAIAFEGAYLLLQDDGFQRILSLDRGGIVSQVSDQQTLIGFSEGRGTWKQVGPDSIRARVIDFAFDPKDGTRAGPSVIDYELTFSDLRAGAYQTVTGSYAGKQYGTGVNPLDATEAPVRTYGVDFKGQRITLD